MHNLIKYVSDILNVKTEGVYTIQDMTEELGKVQDIVAYRGYIKDNIQHIDLDYTTGYQKFIILTRKYLDLEYEASKGIECNQKASKLATKVKVCRNYIEDTNGAFSAVKTVDGNLLFDEDDIAMLKRAGSAIFIIEASKCNTLEDRFRKLYKQKSMAKPYEQLPQRLKDMTKQIGSNK